MLPYNSVDAPMWFFKAVQEYGEAVQDDAAVWKSYGAKMKAVLKAYRWNQRICEDGG